MCGILGTIPASDTSIFNKALDTLNHRGPDSKGAFHDENISLGHTRLKIIDLSNKAAQPMHFPFSLIENEVKYNTGGGG